MQENHCDCSVDGSLRQFLQPYAFLLFRNQPRDCCEPGGYRQHFAVTADAEVLEGETLGFKETGKAHALVSILC